MSTNVERDGRRGEGARIQLGWQLCGRRQRRGKRAGNCLCAPSYGCLGGSANVWLQAHVETGEYVHTIQTTAPAPCVAWHPSRYWLAYSGDPMGLKIVGAAGGNL